MTSRNPSELVAEAMRGSESEDVGEIRGGQGSMKRGAVRESVLGDLEVGRVDWHVPVRGVLDAEEEEIALQLLLVEGKVLRHRHQRHFQHSLGSQHVARHPLEVDVQIFVVDHRRVQRVFVVEEVHRCVAE